MIENINKYIEHTVLSAFATSADVERVCAEAKKYDFASVCINPMYVKKAAELKQGSEIDIVFQDCTARCTVNEIIMNETAD